MVADAAVLRYGPGPLGATRQSCTFALGTHLGQEPVYCCWLLRKDVTLRNPHGDRVSPAQRACGSYRPSHVQVTDPFFPSQALKPDSTSPGEVGRALMRLAVERQR